MVIGIAIPVKNPCCVRVMGQALLHGFRKDLGLAFKRLIWLPPFGKHPKLHEGLGIKQANFLETVFYSYATRKSCSIVHRNCRKSFHVPFCMNS